MAVMQVPPYDPEAGGPEYTWRRVANHLSARIDAGEFAPGSMLPGERRLAEEYGVALGTVRHAIDDLVSRGVLVRLAAKGTFVTRPGQG